MSPLARYVVLDKAVGETPLSCVEAWREKHPAYAGVSLAYAGRLDPMASGKLLVLIGDECKHQEQYHGLDKAYTFEALFGISSDSGDVLGLVTEAGEREVAQPALKTTLAALVGEISLPYPIFSARTVHGKPLHTWAVEGRLHEIEVPTKHSHIYELAERDLRRITRTELVALVSTKIESIPPVTDPRKALGNDFRRPEVRAAWQRIRETGQENDTFTVATITCIAASGTYMRSLAEEIGRRLGTKALALSIHRDTIGRYDRTSRSWESTFT